MGQNFISSTFVLESPRLFLRDFCLEDLDQVHAYASSDLVVTYQEWGPNSLEQSLEFIHMSLWESQMSPRVVYNLAMVEKDQGNVVGACTLYIHSANKEAEIGFSLNPRFWNLGYATEAARTLVTYALRQQKIHRVFATCRPENVRSAAVLQKIPMVLEGRMRENKLIRGKWWDSLLFSVLSHEWLIA